MFINTQLIDLKNSHFNYSWILKKINLKIKSLNIKKNIKSKNIIYLADINSSLENFKFNKKFLPKENESFALIPINKDKNKIIIAYGANERGLIYAITELLDRLNFCNNLKDVFDLKKTLIERPATKIRSISKCFESNIEALEWFHDRKMWRDYLLMLVSQRFNRFTLTLGMQYNYPYGNEFIKDVYFYLAYPFFVTPKGYSIYVENLSKAEQRKNLKTLKFISEETARCGLDFQLALWTQKYDFNEVPNANYQIKKAPLKRYPEYCRDSLAMILKECPNIKGITLRAHVECGIPEGQYTFWKIYFEAIKNAGRKIEIDLHAKGIDKKLINLALEASNTVNISPKYISEHMGLPYHQASVRSQEMPPKENVDKLVKEACIWSSFSGSITKIISNRVSIPSIRGKRYFGPSQMNLFNLLIHSFSIIAVFKKTVIVRSILFLLIYLFFIYNNLSFITLLPAFVIFIFLLLIIKVSYREDIEQLNSSLENIRNIDFFKQS